MDGWYQVREAGSPLEQGDQVIDVGLIESYVDEAGDLRARKIEADIVVLTQTCDLLWKKTENVLVAPTYRLGEWLEESPLDFDRMEEIRQGNDATAYLLPGWPEGGLEPFEEDRIVDLGRILSIPVPHLTRTQTSAVRLGLQNPVREHFSQAVARSFMRVAVPETVPSFRNWQKPEEERRTLNALPVGAGDAEVSLLSSIEVSVRSYTRAATNCTYVLVKARGKQPPIVGVGRDEKRAMLSFSRHMAKRRSALASGDGETSPWLWITEYLA